MNSIYTLYWPVFQKVFFFISLGMSLNLFLALKLNKSQLKVMGLISWFSSLALLVAMYFLTYFSGILYDELQIPTDKLLLFFSLYVTLVFFLQTLTLFLKYRRLKQKAS